MRNRFAETFYELGKVDERLCLLVADISPAGSIEKFRKEFPKRFVNTGVAEQIMVGMAAGMAQRGLRPFVYTIATFALYRPFEFIRNDLCYQDLPVTIVGIGGGLTYSTLGATHHAQEDIAIASSIPGLKIISPCDPSEVEAATRWCAQQEEGPVYLRLGKAGEPELTQHIQTPWQFGQWRQVQAGESLAIVTYGTVSKQCIDACKALNELGLSPSLYFASTIEPFDHKSMEEILNTHQTVLVVEEHISFGGLGMRIKSFALDNFMGSKIKVLSLPQAFSHIYGTHHELLRTFGISSDRICEVAQALIEIN